LKEKFREICKNYDIPLFLTDCWMDAVNENDWDVVIYEENNVALAFFVYASRFKAKMRIIGSPQLTQFSGLYFIDDFKHVKDKVKIQNRIIDNLVLELPKYSKLSLSLHTSIFNLQGFYWKDFKLSFRYTYQINNTKLYDLNSVSQKARNRINKIKDKYILKTTNDMKLLHNLHNHFIKERHKKISYSLELLESIERISRKLECGQAFFLESKLDCTIVSVCYIVWDSFSAYLIINGSRFNLKDGSNLLMIYLVIKWVSDYSDIFDFEGSMIEDVESTYRNLGGKQNIYFNINHTPSRLLRVYDMLRSI
jgi:hypothetical protein